MSIYSRTPRGSNSYRLSRAELKLLLPPLNVEIIAAIHKHSDERLDRVINVVDDFIQRKAPPSPES